MNSRSIVGRLQDDSTGSQAVRYLLVGAWNTLFGYLVFLAIWYLWGARLGYGGTLGAALIISVMQSYATQRWLVWRSRNAVHRELPRFLAVYALTYAGNLALLWLLVDRVGMQVPLAQALATGVVVAATFVLLRTFAFAQSHTRHTDAGRARGNQPSAARAGRR